jgi:hypothetical protein
MASSSVVIAVRDIALHDRPPEIVELGCDDVAAGAARHRLDEAREARVFAQPEERRLSAEALHRVEFPHREGDGPRVRRIVEVHPSIRLKVRRGLAVGDDQQHGLRGGVAPEVPLREQ